MSSDTPVDAVPPPAPQLRADARRNRDRLIDAARVAFRDGSPDRADSVALEAIAKAAGVGIGTLYRHFPTRDALVAALYEAELDEVEALGAQLLRRHTALEALRRWIRRYAEFVQTKHGMQDALQVAWTSQNAPVPGTRARVTNVIAGFLDAGTTDGTIRSDVLADDVTASLVGAFIATRTADDPAQTLRVSDILLDGLRPRG